MPRATFRLEGYTELMRKLHADELYARPWRRALLASVMELEREVKNRAPRGRTRNLAQSVTHKLDGRTVPLWGVVKANASNSRGYRYPWALEAGHGTRRGGRTYIFHFLGTNKTTRRWFKGSVTKVRRYIKANIANAATEIERAWGR